MKTLTIAFVLLLVAAALQTTASAASFEPSARAADSTGVPGLGLDPAGGGLLEIPPATFT